MSARLLQHILMKRAQVADPDVDGFTGSRLLPPLVPEPVTPIAPKPVSAAPVPAPVTPPKVKAYIPPPTPGNQTAAQRAAWQAAINAQGGQGDAGSSTQVGYGPKP